MKLQEQVSVLKRSEFKDSYSVLLTRKCQDSVSEVLDTESHVLYTIQTVGSLMRRFVLSKLGLEASTRFLYSDEYETALNIISSEEYHKVLLENMYCEEFILKFYNRFGYKSSVDTFKHNNDALKYIDSLHEGEF